MQGYNAAVASKIPPIQGEQMGDVIHCHDSGKAGGMHLHARDVAL